MTSFRWLGREEEIKMGFVYKPLKDLAFKLKKLAEEGMNILEKL